MAVESGHLALAGKLRVAQGLFRDRVQFCSSAVDFVVWVGRHGCSFHRLALACKRFVGRVAKDLACVFAVVISGVHAAIIGRASPLRLLDVVKLSVDVRQFDCQTL